MHTVVYEPKFDVIGIGIRTSNQLAISEGTIGILWQRFFAESVYDSIPNKSDDAILAVYYDFENDKNGQYNLLIGSRVCAVDTIPNRHDDCARASSKQSDFYL